MHFYCCNDAVPCLNEVKSRIFQCTVIFKNFQIHLYFVCHLSACLPTCCKTQFHYMYGSNFSHKECNWHLQYESVVPGKIYTLCHGDFFHPSLASLFFSKVSNSWKKVLITPGLYFCNYCVTDLPYDSSHDFNKCEHVNLRWEWTCVVFEELYYAANNQKIADKKKADYQEGLETSCDSYMKDPEQSCAWSRESYMKDPEKSRADSAAWSCESYKKDLEKNCDDSAAWSRESQWHSQTQAY